MELIDDRIVGHQFAYSLPLPNFSSSGLEYWVGQNGIFARAARPGIEVLTPLGYHQPAKGLVSLDPYLKVEPLVPGELLLHVWVAACQASDPATDHLLEALFHLVWFQGHWQLVTPEQKQDKTSCQPIDTSADSSTCNATIEIHSHGAMEAFFSPTDDRDESSGFRLYGVMGKVRSPRPQMLMRVGLFGHCWHVPLAWVFALKGGCFFEDLGLQDSRYYHNQWENSDVPQL
jgi:PRTRC genetic system protein A